MDKECVLQMLHNLRDGQFLGPITGDYSVGDRVIYALEKGLISHSDTGSFIVTEKGLDLLEEKISWENL